MSNITPPDVFTQPEYADSVSRTSKLSRLSREHPYLPIGILGCIGAVAYGIRNYKNRGGMSTSVYLMQFRVISQSMVVGAIAVGATAMLVPKLWNYSKTDRSD